MKRLLLLILACGVLVACATSPTGRSQLMLVSPQAAIVESKKAYLSTVGELSKEDKLVTDPALSKRVATITGRLVTVAIEKFPYTAKWEWSVAIVDDPKVVNAWCMAGGRMAVYTGLFEKLHLTDAEFAQIMGHEISHALANHTAEQMSRAMATTLGVVAVGAMSTNRASPWAAPPRGKGCAGLAQQPHGGKRSGRDGHGAGGTRRLRPRRRGDPVAENVCPGGAPVPRSSSAPTRPRATARPRWRR
ncbi:MAG: M48 family metalloprotease [Halioglobus sp.]